MGVLRSYLCSPLFVDFPLADRPAGLRPWRIGLRTSALADRPAVLRLRCGDTPAFRTIRRKTEVFNMYIDRKTLLELAEKELNTKAGANGDWCIDWLKRIWWNEINSAICDVTRRNP